MDALRIQRMGVPLGGQHPEEKALATADLVRDVGIKLQESQKRIASAPILAALATSCRMFLSRERVQLADRKEALEFHLEWNLQSQSTTSRFGAEIWKVGRLAVRLQPKPLR